MCGRVAVFQAAVVVMKRLPPVSFFFYLFTLLLFLCIFQDIDGWGLSILSLSLECKIVQWCISLNTIVFPVHTCGAYLLVPMFQNSCILLKIYLSSLQLLIAWYIAQNSCILLGNNSAHFVIFHLWQNVQILKVFRFLELDKWLCTVCHIYPLR